MAIECKYLSAFIIALIGQCKCTGDSCCAIPALVLLVAIAAGLSTLQGFLFLITGHAILRLTDLAEYSEYSVRSSMLVGAVGGAIMFPAILVFRGIAEDCLGVRDQVQRASGCSVIRSMLNLGIATALGAAAGAVGSKVLLPRGFSVIDPVHAARAGALGGVVLGPGIVICGFM